MDDLTGSALISAAGAIEAAKRADTVFLDATWSFSGGPQPVADGVIPGAIAFDIDTVKDEDNPLPHMLPTPEEFRQHVEIMGISNTSHVIVYDRMGVFSAPRVWWMFRTMGHDQVQVLDGGLPAWIAARETLSNHHAAPGERGRFEPSFASSRLASRDDVLAAALNGGTTILDARPEARFRGQASEPRPGMRSGHMPGALNMPYRRLLTSNGGLKPPHEVWPDMQLPPNTPVITSCGSGVTACILALSLYEYGIEASVYDGSWAEWGSRADTPIIANEEEIAE